MGKIYTVSNYDNKPFIRLTGKWLEKYGFNIGDKLEFIEGKNIIILAKVPNAKTRQLEKDFEIKQLTKRLNDINKLV